MTASPADTAATARAAAAAEPAHEAFRAVLDALARPGTRKPLADNGVPAVLRPVLALADLGTGVHLAGADGWVARWADAVALATDADPVPPDRARLLVLGPGAPSDVLARAAVGSAAAPEHGALVAVAVTDALAGGPALRLSGPGVPGHRVIAPSGLPAGWRPIRDAAPYPAGIDLLLVDAHGVVGVPRSTRIEEGN